MLRRVCLFVFVVTALPLGGAARAAPSSIKVAETWADLLDREPVDTGRGARVRLGVEATERPQWSGVLLYCLYHEPDQFFESHNEPPDVLGPVRVYVRHESEPAGTPRRVVDRGEAGSYTMPVVQNARLLFVKPIALPERGLYEIGVYSHDDRLLASCAVRSVAAGVHPWTPFAVDWEERRAGRPIVRNSAEGIALPSWGGTTVLVFDGKADEKLVARDRGERLPTLVPRSPDPSLRLSLKDDVIELTADDRIYCREELNFLVRWWVNGEPYTPRPTKRLARQVTGQTPWECRWSARLEFVPETCGAKPGDKVAFQVLHCADGWDYVSDQRRHSMQQQRPDLKGDGPVRMSNVVEFTVK